MEVLTDGGIVVTQAYFDAMRAALDKLEDYTTELWYGTPTLRGKTEDVVRRVRRVLGRVSADRWRSADAQ